MPTYTVTTANLSLSTQQKSRVAEAITAAHSDHTGAPRFFAQVRFFQLEAGEHYIGGKLNEGPLLFVSGMIREGRSVDVKQALMSQMLEQIAAITAMEAEDIWIYLQDVAAEQMIEFGRFLPAPGQEDEWVKGLSPAKQRALF
ncbi:MAG TPA: tautomerase family protein [Anaerolineales bacterium]|nr:tautomerase family protein [Anaerolineales bacterium]